MFNSKMVHLIVLGFCLAVSGVSYILMSKELNKNRSAPRSIDIYQKYSAYGAISIGLLLILFSVVQLII